MAPEIDEFGKKIIQLVRDPTIMSAEIIRNKFSRSPTRLKLNSYDEEIVQEILDIVIPKVVDNTIFYTLRAMDGGGLRMIYRSDAGNAAVWTKKAWENWLDGSLGTKDGSRPFPSIPRGKPTNSGIGRGSDRYFAANPRFPFRGKAVALCTLLGICPARSRQ